MRLGFLLIKSPHQSTHDSATHQQNHAAKNQ